MLIPEHSFKLIALIQIFTFVRHMQLKCISSRRSLFPISCKLPWLAKIDPHELPRNTDGLIKGQENDHIYANFSFKIANTRTRENSTFTVIIVSNLAWKDHCISLSDTLPYFPVIHFHNIFSRTQFSKSKIHTRSLKNRTMQSSYFWIQMIRFGSCNFLNLRNSYTKKTWYSGFYARRADSTQFHLSN